MESTKKPWKAKWEILDQIGSGGQGTTFKVQSYETGGFGCLKLLTNNEAEERRGRFRREAVALKTINHPSVPKVLDDNSVDFKTDKRLYIVSEYIDGITLNESVSRKVLTQERGIELVLKILEILKVLHNEDIIHRDLKPDNVILRANNDLDPVIVDFGLSYLNNTSFSTLDPHQQLGNRFLHLPELQTVSSDKRNPVSDVTQVCGLLFFMCTGHPPETLRDSKDLLPHQRNFPNFDRSVLSADLLGIFDRGFRTIIGERWQSCDELITKLLSVSKDSEETAANQNFAQFASQFGKNPEVQHWTSTKSIFEDFKNESNLVLKNIIEEFPNNAMGISYSEVVDWEKSTHTAIRKFFPHGNPSISLLVKIRCQILGNEAIINLAVPNHKVNKTIGRLGLVDNINWIVVMDSLANELKAILMLHFKSLI